MNDCFSEGVEQTCMKTTMILLILIDEMNKCIKNLNTTKPTTHGNIPAKILVEHSDLCSEHIHKLYCDSVQTGIFPNSMKYADITPSHKERR